jgi:hypothetical protein
MPTNPWTHEFYLIKRTRLDSYTNKEVIREPKPPYKDEEVPQWWPKFIRKYLTKVSRESCCGYYPHVIDVPRDPTLTLEQTMEQVRKRALADLEEDGGPEKYFKYEIEKHPELSIEEITRIYLENEELDGLSIMVGNNGCTFSDQCDPRNGRIYHHCGDDRDDRDYGEIGYHRRYLE